MRATVSKSLLLGMLLATASAAAQTPPPRPAAKPASPSPAAPKPAAPAPARAAAAKPAAAGSAASPVAFAHLHLQVKDVEAERKFWVDGLQGMSAKAGITSGQAVKFPNLLVFLQQGTAKGGSKGSIVDHVAFEVQSLKPLVEKLKKAGYKMVTREEANSVYLVTDDVAYMPDQATSSAVVLSPDGMEVELVENKQAAAPIAFKHIHFAAPSVSQMKEWYVKALGARIGTRGFGFEGLDLGKQAGVLVFTLASDKAEATAGRVNDRIGFEVRGAALLAKKLEKLGARVTRPYGKSPDASAMSVVVTDPWGTSIELTEGLTKVG